MRPLEGIRVLEFGQAFSAPFCGMMMADMGAEVIKMERPPLGDPARYNAPGQGGASAYFSSRNRGKKSMLMDLSDPQQKDVFLKIVADTDVILENFKPGTLEKYGCGYDDLRKIKPDIILTSISGFGQTGPMRSRAAYDLVIQAESGFISVTGDKNGGVTACGYIIADAVAGLTGCVGTLTALQGRDRTGEGQHVDISMLESLIATMESCYGTYMMNGKIPVPQGIGTPGSAPFQPFPVKDGSQVLICVNTDEQWERLCRVLERPELITDPRFSGGAFNRKMHEEELAAEIAPTIAQREKDELCRALEQAHIVFGQVNNIQDVVNSKQFQDREMRCTVHYSGNDANISAISSALRMSGVEHAQTYTAPWLGDDTIEICSQYMPAEKAHEIYDTLLAESSEAARKKKIQVGIV